MSELLDPSQEAPARRTQAERRDASQRELVEAAIAVVAEEGVSAATFEAIGRRAGKSRGLATQRFGSKQGLIEAVITHLHDLQMRRLAEHGVDRMSGLEAVLAYVELFFLQLSRNSDHRAYFRLLSSAVAEGSDLRAGFAREHGRVERILETMILRGQSAGDIRPGIDADAAALMIGSQLLGVSMALLVDPDMDIAPIGETLLATLRLGFGAPTDTPKG